MFELLTGILGGVATGVVRNIFGGDDQPQQQGEDKRAILSKPIRPTPPERAKMRPPPGIDASRTDRIDKVAGATPAGKSVVPRDVNEFWGAIFKRAIREAQETTNG